VILFGLRPLDRCVSRRPTFARGAPQSSMRRCPSRLRRSPRK
jgi:hypothetical protein